MLFWNERTVTLKPIPTTSKHNVIMIILDAFIKLAIITLIVMLIVTKQFIIAAISTIISIPVMFILMKIILSINLDMMCEKNDTLYFKPRGTREMHMVDVDKCLLARNPDTVEWNIDGIYCISEIPPTLMRLT